MIEWHQRDMSRIRSQNSFMHFFWVSSLLCKMVVVSLYCKESAWLVLHLGHKLIVIRGRANTIRLLKNTHSKNRGSYCYKRFISFLLPRQSPDVRHWWSGHLKEGVSLCILFSIEVRSLPNTTVFDFANFPLLLY